MMSFSCPNNSVWFSKPQSKYISTPKWHDKTGALESKGMSPLSKNLFVVATLALLLAGCATRVEMKTQRAKLISVLEEEMLTNTQWLRIHAAEGLLDNGHIGKIPELFRPESDTATAPYRIGVWRVLARSTNEEERNSHIERIRSAMRDPQAIDRISAAESLGKINAASRADRDLISNWLKTADDATVPFPRWLLVLSSDPSERESDEAALANLLKSNDPVARLRAAFALGRLKNISSNSISKFREQLKVEPADSIARIYFITALLLHVKDASIIADLEKELIPYLNNGKPNELLEIGIAIGLRGNAADLQMLEPLLKNPEPDARIGAANGMLQLLK
jgi:HEAT repeat protein